MGKISSGEKLYDEGEKLIHFKHSANSGDLVAAMAGVKKLCEERGAKAVIHQRLNMPAFYYQGASHPTKSSDGVEVCMNAKMYSMMVRLLGAQDYIDSCVVWQGEKVDFDLDEIRNHFVNMPYGNIQRWYGYVYPQMFCDLSKSWIKKHDKAFIDGSDDTIVINFTSRYRNPEITYYFLKEYEDRLLFVGNDVEYETFCKEWNLDIMRAHIDDFLELSELLSDCKFFLGNQSMCYNIAEAMKIPRIVEACSFAPNCTPHGADGYEFYHQPALEYFFKQLQ